MRRLWNWAAPSIEVPLENKEGFHFTGDLERQKECSGNGASLSKGALLGESGGRAPSLGDPEGYVKESSGNRYLSP